MNLRVYTNKGKEYFVTRPGQIVPAGHLNGATFKPFEYEMVVVMKEEELNPYDQDVRKKKYLVLTPHK